MLNAESVGNGLVAGGEVVASSEAFSPNPKFNLNSACGCSVDRFTRKYRSVQQAMAANAAHTQAQTASAFSKTPVANDDNPQTESFRESILDGINQARFNPAMDSVPFKGTELKMGFDSCNSPNSAAYKCALTEECVAFSYDKDNGECKFYSSTSNGRLPKLNTDTYLKKR